MLNRRDWLKLAAGSSLAYAVEPWAKIGDSEDAKLVVILLRGAMDGLAAVVPYGDKDYQPQRGALALPAPGHAQGTLKLDGTFALHPKLVNLHNLYQGGELVVLHAVATPYRERSHFDGQKILENGSARAGGSSGWLNRALAANPLASMSSGMAIGSTVPLLLRGSVPVSSWAPSRLPDADDDTFERIADLYSQDAFFAARFKEALAAEDLLDEVGLGGEKRFQGRGTKARVAMIVGAVTKLLAQPDGPDVVAIDINGWDTHANQGAANGALANKFVALDEAIAALKDSATTTWQRTSVLVVTEFGRTVAVNGTGGTDHGTGGVAFLCGGAVNGGQVISDWPGLSKSSLYMGRDLKPTLDLRAAIKGVLHEHSRVSLAKLETEVFPDSRSVKPLKDLIRPG